MPLSTNTRAAKATGGVQRHGKCSGEWMKRSKVSRSETFALGYPFTRFNRSAGFDPIATLQY